MRIAVINTQNSLLSGAIVKYMHERGEMKTERVLSGNAENALKTCISVDADILLIEITGTPPYTFEQRTELIKAVHGKLPYCRIAVICDENASPDIAAKVKSLRKERLIDAFFYSSVSGEYLADVLDTM